MDRTEAHCHVRLVNKQGLHARPSQMMVEIANEFEADVTIRIGENEANAKSVLELMMLASPLGSELEIRAQGKDAEHALTALAQLVQRGFGEELG